MIIYPVIPPEVIELFLDNLIQVDDCLEWIGGTSKGYGQFYHGVEGIGHGAHRFAFALHNGYIDTELMVCHTCDNPPCCKGEHLFQGTSKDNMDDMRAKGRARGSGNLSDADVQEICRLRELGAGYRELAIRFSVNNITIWNICTRKQKY